MDDFQKFINKERERVTNLKVEITAKIAELTEQLATAERSLLAVDAYEAAKAGKLKAARAPRATGTRSPKGGKRAEVLELLAKHGAMGRADIITAFNIKGKKKEEQNLSNLLTNMKKGNLIVAKDGKYAPAT